MSSTEADDGPVICPVCGAEFESVSVHDEGVMVTLAQSDRFDRLCFQPVEVAVEIEAEVEAEAEADTEAEVETETTPVLRFFQHTAEQAGTDQPGSAGGRIP